MLDLGIGTDYSPKLRMWLEANGRTWPIAKLGPDHFVPTAGFELSPCDARIVMTVDGEEHYWQVRIVDGVFPFDDSVRIQYYRDTDQSAT